jgi:Flp pilus assembly protein TadG
VTNIRPLGLARRSSGTPAPDRARGQGLVEFALVLPILALLLLAIIQFSFIFAAQIGVTNAVREAARIGAVTTPTTTDSQATTTAPIIYDRLTNTFNGLLKRNVFAFAEANIVTSGAVDTRVCYREAQDLTSGEYTIFVKVEGGYRHLIFIPLLGGLLDGIDGVSDGGLQIGTAEEMRVENDTLVSPSSPTISACYP